MQKKHKVKIEVDSIKNADLFLKNAIELYSIKDYKNALIKLSDAHKIFLANKELSKVSICLSLTGLIKYLDKKEDYYKSLLLLEDSKFLAESAESTTTQAVNKFAFGQIYFEENKHGEALFYLIKALNSIDDFPILKIKIFELLYFIYLRQQDIKTADEYIEKAICLAISYGYESIAERLKEIYEKYSNTNNVSSSVNNNDVEQNTTLLLALSKIARTVNAEVNLDKLLFTIAEQTKLVLNADRCSVFLYDKSKNELWSKVALGLGSEEIRFSADKGFAGYVVKTGETIRIQDVYNDSRFNKEIDKHTGYKTHNMLCMPMRNIKYEIIGVFQVLNKQAGDFTDADEEILLAIGTNAAIAIENNMLFSIQQRMIKEQQELFTGFIDTLAASIDARDKITLGHSNRVRLYSELICKKLGLNKEVTNIIAKAAMLHDIGKIGIRDAVLQKKGSLTKEEYEHIKEHVKITYDILCKTNMNSSFSEIAEIAASHHEKYDGTGYFRSLKGEEIPLGGRILAVGDVFDAITSVRHYRDRMPMKDVLNIISEGRNKHFDGKITDAFLDLSCACITKVLISDYASNFKAEDEEKLAKLNLRQLFEMFNKKQLNEEELNVINLFNSYYIRPQTITVNV